MLEEYLDKIEKEGVPEGEDVNINDSPIFNPCIMEDTLKNIDKISDQDLYDLLKRSYKDFLNDVFNKKENNYIQLFKNSRFLSIFIQVINSITDLSYEDRVYCNKIAYDYMILPKTDKYIKQLLVSLSKIVNRNIIPSLIGLGLSEYLSSYIALARYSSLREDTNIKRVNFIIISSPMNIMNEQMIVYIYEKLFDKIGPVFTSIMIDTYNEEDGYSEEMEQMYSIISLSILDILENMTSDDIRKILVSYVWDYNSFHINEETRFSMQALSNDYARICSVVDYLRIKENIYVP